jgi:hypothetical protein
MEATQATGASSAFLRANGHLTVEEYLQQQLEMQVPISSCVGVTIMWQYQGSRCTRPFAFCSGVHTLVVRMCPWHEI